MRFASRINLLLLFLGAAVASAQINPATQIRWPNNCTGGNLYYDIVHNTCTAGNVVGVNGTSLANPNFSDTTPAAPAPNQNVHFQTDGSNVSAYVEPSAGGTSTCLADRQVGSTWDVKVNACLNLIYANGGGTVDARNLTGAQTMAADVTVGDGTHSTILLMGAMTLTRNTGAQFLVNTDGQMIGMGPDGTVIAGDTTIPAVQQAWHSNGVNNSHWEHFSVWGNVGSVTAGVPGIQFSGPNAGMPFASWPGAATQSAFIGNPGVTFVPRNPWSGYIGQFAFYNKALTAAQIANHYSAGTTGTTYESTVIADGPMAYYPLKETTGTVATDLSGHGYNGTYSSAGITLASVSGIPGDTSCSGVCKMPLFDGTSGSVALPSMNWLAGNVWTVEGWYQPNVPDGGAFRSLWAINDASYEMVGAQNSANDGLQLDIFGQGAHAASPQTTLNSGQLYHIVAVHTIAAGPSLMFYVNGAPIRVGNDVLTSFLSDVKSTGFDIGILMRSEGGCICYNSISDLNVVGASYGLYSDNVSGYSYGMNSNTFINGRYGGPVGVSVNDGNDNVFIKPDVENAATHSMVIADYGDILINPYFESDGKLELDGGSNMVLVSGMSQFDWTGSCTDCMIFGPNTGTNSLGTIQGYMLGAYASSNATMGLINSGPFNGAELVFEGGATGQGYYGHAPFTVGSLGYRSGLYATGSSSLRAIGSLAAPSAVATGGTGTTYTYYAIGYDALNNPVMPSAPVTVSGPATLDSTHYISITPTQVDGIKCIDILKGDTSHILTVDGTNHCSVLSSNLGMVDRGQATVAFTPPTRDTTGDFYDYGALTANMIGIPGCPAGSLIKGDYSGCQTVVQPSSTTVGTSAVSANACSSAFTVSMAGLTTSMGLKFTPQGDISAVAGWGPGISGQLYFISWASAGTANYKVCNPTSSSITPSASTTWTVSAQ